MPLCSRPVTNQDRTPQAASTPNRAARRAAHRRAAAAVGSAALLTTVSGAVGVLASGAPAGAAGYTVTTCDDSGPGSLRYAITLADGNSTDDVITITATCTASSPVDVSSAMTVNSGYALEIVGPGAADFVLDGGDNNVILYFDNTSGDVTISGVTFQHGSNTECGGAIEIAAAGDVTISSVVAVDNYTAVEGGGFCITNAGDVAVSNSTFARNDANDGAALYVVDSDRTTITTSTFDSNVATGDGGAVSIDRVGGLSVIANSTFSGNVAGQNAGAIFFDYVYADVRLEFNTVVGNSAYYAGGLYMRSMAYNVDLVGNIFSGNTDHAGDDQIVIGPDWAISEYSNDFHGGGLSFVPDASDLDVDPQLGSLADNGGPTQTMALAVTSPLIDQGPATWEAFPGEEYDQRGTPYVRVYGTAADIGAYEWQPGPDPGPGPDPTPGPTPEPTPEPSFTG